MTRLMYRLAWLFPTRDARRDWNMWLRADNARLRFELRTTRKRLDMEKLRADANAELAWTQRQAALAAEQPPANVVGITYRDGGDGS